MKSNNYFIFSKFIDKYLKHKANKLKLKTSSTAEKS